jgi:hypothetical protein
VERLVDGDHERRPELRVRLLHPPHIAAQQPAVVLHEMRHDDDHAGGDGPAGPPLEADPRERAGHRQRVRGDVQQQRPAPLGISAQPAELVQRLPLRLQDEVPGEVAHEQHDEHLAPRHSGRQPRDRACVA